MAGNTYRTRQKETILDCLQQNAEQALTVDEITERIGRAGEKVGRTTVYRFMETLLGEGRVRKFTDPAGKGAAFQYVPDPTDCERHMHLKCSACGKYIHLDCKTMQQVNAHIFADHQFRVDNSKSLLVGLCADCMKEGRHGSD